ncbi:MAG TPA: GTPase HflX [Polyangiales bacterium]|nr:GTPase HflX [Polyangiales bacterium]
MEIYGNTTGLGPSERKALERLYRRRVPFAQLTTSELTRGLCEASQQTRRQVGVLIDRAGQIEYVVVGDSAKLFLPDLGRQRAGSGRFRGLRLIHTHLRGEPLTRDDLVDLTRLRLDLVAAICVSPEGDPRTVTYAHCVPVNGSKQAPYRSYGPVPYSQLDVNPAQLVGAVEEEFAKQARTRHVGAKDGRAILLHVCEKQQANAAEASLRELAELSRTAGVDVADSVLQVRDRLDPKYVVGRGKLEDIVIAAMQLDADVLIVDRNLNAAQANAIAKVTDLKVIDRTQLILDIFAQHAQSQDGKLEVELAQTRYLLPRLGSRDDSLSRLTGGIGGRGPGETKLEIGKRRARERVAYLEGRLAHLERRRSQQRKRRTQSDAPMVAIVGYTNAGKSTLLNALTGSDVLVQDKLFATLDTRSRRLRAQYGRELVLTDTVGFIRDLPRELFSAFKATFEEAAGADLLLHVVDAADPAHEEHVRTTQELLQELELAAVPRLVVLNKADRLPAEEAQHLALRYDAVAVSALDRQTLEPLRNRLLDLCPQPIAEPLVAE